MYVMYGMVCMYKLQDNMHSDTAGHIAEMWISAVKLKNNAFIVQCKEHYCLYYIYVFFIMLNYIFNI